MKKQRNKTARAPLTWRTLLPYLMTWATGETRYLPEIQWSRNWTYNVFRLYESIFWRRFGIRAEMSSSARVKDGVQSETTYAFHTLESALVFAEDKIRAFFREWKLAPFKIYIPVLATPSGMPVFASPYLFAIAVDATSSGYKNNAGTTWSIAHTISGSNTILWCGWIADASNVVTGDYNGSAMTAEANATSNDVSTARSGLLMKVAPTTGTNNINYTRSINSGTVECMSASYSGASQTGQPDATATAVAITSTPIAPSITTVASNCWIVLIINMRSATTMTAGTNTHLRTENPFGALPSGDAQELFDTNSAQGAGGSKTLNVAYTGTLTAVVGSMASFAPASSSYNQTVAATGAGAAALLAATTFARTYAATAVGAASIVKSVGKTLASTGVGVSALFKRVSKTMSATGAGIAILAKGMFVTLASTGAGVATMSAIRVFLVTLATVAQGIAVITKTPGKVLATTGAGVATMVKSVGKTLASSGAGVAVVVKSVGKSIAAVGQGVATVTNVIGKVLATTAQGVATMTKSVGKVLHAVGVGSAVITATRGVILAATANAVATVTKTAGKLLSVTARVVALIRRDFWRTKYTSQGDDYDIKYPHGD